MIQFCSYVEMHEGTIVYSKEGSLDIGYIGYTDYVTKLNCKNMRKGRLTGGIVLAHLLYNFSGISSFSPSRRHHHTNQSQSSGNNQRDFEFNN